MSKLPNKWLVVVSVLFGTFTVILNNSMLNPTLPRFMEIFDANAVSVGWMLTIFMVAMGMTMPITGYLGDRFGKKKVYISGLCIFVLGSLSGSLASNLTMVILSRAVQGMAGGLMMPIAMALIFHAFPKNERGIAVGTYGIAAMVAPAIGPTVGGVIIQFFSWPFLFLFNIPFALVGILLSTKFLKETEQNTGLKFDIGGFILVTLGIGTILLALGRGRELSTLTEVSNLGLIVLGIVSIIVFVFYENRQKQPLLNLSVFKVPTYSFSIVVTGAASIGLFSGIFLLPLLIQEVYGLDEIQTGLLFLPAAALSGIFMRLGGRILDKKGPRSVIPIGLFVMGSATVALGFLELSTPYWLILILNAIRGGGMGMSNMPATTAGMNAIPDPLVAQGSAMNNVLRQITSSFGIVFFSIYYETRRSILASGGMDMTAAKLQTLNEAFLVSAAVLFLAIPFAWFMKGSSDEPEEAASE